MQPEDRNEKTPLQHLSEYGEAKSAFINEIVTHESNMLVMRARLMFVNARAQENMMAAKDWATIGVALWRTPTEDTKEYD